MTDKTHRRWAWAFTGSGHFIKETISLIGDLDQLDLFVSRAAVEVLKMYKVKLDVGDGNRVFYDKTASAVPVGAFYHGLYHTLVVAPATSNAVAKFVHGISDDLVSNIFAHAGKTRVPTLVFACDTAPELLTVAPKGPVKVFPRAIDLQNRIKVGDFLNVSVVDSVAELATAVANRHNQLTT